MSCLPRALKLVAVASIALSASALALAREPPRNFVLIVPEALPAVGVDQTNAPALARLRHDGVNFINSHSGFPRLTHGDPFSPRSELQVQALVSAAVQQYSAALANDVRGSGLEPSSELKKVMNDTLPRFKAIGKPFLLVYRIAEPKYAPPPPGEARPAYKPAPRATHMVLESIEGTLKSLGLVENTNVIVAAEHAYSRILKVSHTSRARTVLPLEETLGTLPPGFLAIDVIAALQTEADVIHLFDPDNGNAVIDWSSGGYPTRGNAIIADGYDPLKPLVTIEAHGAYGSIFLADRLPRTQRRAVAHTIIEAMLEQDYLGGIFVDEKRVGQFPGALSMIHVTPPRKEGVQPDMVIAFATVTAGCRQPVTCTSVIADTPLPEGEGVPNAFSRAGTWTFMAARGPDFQSEMINRAPASNADIARTIVELMDLDIERRDMAGSRVLRESLAGARNRSTPKALTLPNKSTASVEGLITEAHLQTLGAARYFDTAIQSHVEAPAIAYAPKAKRRWPQWKRFTISISDEDY